MVVLVVLYPGMMITHFLYLVVVEVKEESLLTLTVCLLSPITCIQ